MNHQVSSGELLDDKGELIEKGYAFSLVRNYSREKIKANKLRIKEWDYYYLGNTHLGVALTIDDNSYMSLDSVTLLDFDHKRETTKSSMGFLSLGKIKFPSTSVKGDVSHKSRNTDMKFLNDGKSRRLICSYKNFKDGKDFFCDLTVKENNDDTMVIITPFNKKKHFYYNQKINNLTAKGSIFLGEEEIKVDDLEGVLDWGRGVWTYKNTWYWSSLSGTDKNGVHIGFNLGYGFGDASASSENMVFINKKGYKLDDVEFLIPKKDNKDDFMSKWKVVSKDRKIDLVFTPIIDRMAYSTAIVISSNQNQVFGYFSGKIIYEEGKELIIDKMIGFAEKVINKW